MQKSNPTANRSAVLCFLNFNETVKWIQQKKKYLIIICEMFCDEISK